MPVYFEVFDWLLTMATVVVWTCATLFGLLWQDLSQNPEKACIVSVTHCVLILARNFRLIKIASGLKIRDIHRRLWFIGLHWNDGCIYQNFSTFITNSFKIFVSENSDLKSFILSLENHQKTLLTTRSFLSQITQLESDDHSATWYLYFD